MKFKGFDNWIEIFRGGKQSDSSGKEHDGDALIDRAIESFDLSQHEPPVVVGHPKDNAPAYAWVEGIKKEVRNGVNVLLAKFKQVVPEFEDLVKRGLFKKRSASFYPDGRLRHVGFLGAAPPAVKGLADLKFTDEETVTFEFSDEAIGTLARMLRRLRDWLIEKEGKEAADAVLPDWDIEYLREQADRNDNLTPATAYAEPQPKEASMFREKFKNFLSFMGVDMSKVPDDALPIEAPKDAVGGQFTEADIEAAKKEAAAAERKKVNAEFAEKERTAAREARGKAISDWADGLVKEGKIIPAWVKMGLKEFCQALNAESEIVFAEGKKTTALDWFKGFIAEMPKVVEFKEIARRDENVQTGDASAKLEALIKQKMAADKTLTYSTAFSEVQKENADLVTEYLQEVRPAQK